MTNIQILEHIEVELMKLGLETNFLLQDGVTLLRAELTDLGRGEHSAIFEVMAVPYAVDGDATLLQFYTTIAVNMDDDNIFPAVIALNSANVGVTIGSLHVFEEIGQLYHKYSIAIDDSWSDDVKKVVVSSALFSTLNVVDAAYDEAIVISDDVTKLPQFYELLEREMREEAE